MLGTLLTGGFLDCTESILLEGWDPGKGSGQTGHATVSLVKAGSARGRCIVVTCPGIWPEDLDNVEPHFSSIHSILPFLTLSKHIY